MIIYHINMYLYVCMYKNETCVYRGMEIHVEIMYTEVYEIFVRRGIYNTCGDKCIWRYALISCGLTRSPSLL